MGDQSNQCIILISITLDQYKLLINKQVINLCVLQAINSYCFPFLTPTTRENRLPSLSTFVYAAFVVEMRTF
jgi:hypothetical protein